MITYRFVAVPTTLQEALALKAQHGPTARVIAGATDLLLEMERGQRRAPDGGDLGLIDLTHIPGLDEIRLEDGAITLGPLVTHNQCVADARLVAHAFPLTRACWEVGAPQIRNRATVAGNLITASPANDAIVPLLALDASVTLTSLARGSRTLPLRNFITGFRRVDLADDELLTAIRFRALTSQQEGTFIKLGLRRAQAISVNSIAAVISWDAARQRVEQAALALGAVAPTVVRAREAEEFLAGKSLDDATIAQAATLAVRAARPIDDIRSSADYRRAMVETLTARILAQLRDGQSRAGWPARPVLLASGMRVVPDPSGATLVNGKPVTLPGGMTLLDSLRAAGYVGVKEGCAEGECGACTVLLDGMAVMACMLPVEQATGSRIVTVEGLGDPARLHPVQAALVQRGGVQCGYCTPGFVMAAAKLLEERPHPTRQEAAEAFTGNFCRCTGYAKILDAAVAASHTHAQEEPSA